MESQLRVALCTVGRDVYENFPGTMQEKGLTMRRGDIFKRFPEVEVISLSLPCTYRVEWTTK